MQPVRTRIAPSPTGEDIHIGNLYTALINFAFARKHNGKFIIRIEDTDRARYVKGAVEKILGTIKAYRIEYDEGPGKGGPFAPYLQSERLPLYKKHAEDLVESKNAYYCFCTKEDLEQIRKESKEQKQITRHELLCKDKNNMSRREKGDSYVIRLRIPRERKITFRDIIHGDIVIESTHLDDQIIIKSDGYPTYHLGVVVDDHEMEISHVIRAEEWISSTPKHVLLYEAFGWSLPVFAHVPILRNPDRSKLSKRKNPVWASWYLKQGFLPEAVLNFLSLMGWSHPEQKEIFSLAEFIEKFELTDMRSVGPVFDMPKLTWMNQQYILHMPLEQLAERIKHHFSWTNRLEQEKFMSIVALAHSRIEVLNDFSDLAKFFLEPPQVRLSEQEKEISKHLVSEFALASAWNSDTILPILKQALEKYHVRMPTLYSIVTGKKSGLPLPESLTLLGKEEIMKRLSRVAA